MNPDEKKALIDRYLIAYNAFDIEAMLALLHPEIKFKNISGGKVNASASGIGEFRKLAEQSKKLFSSRQQTMTKFEDTGERTMIEVKFRGVLAMDFNGMKQEHVLELIGRSEFQFRDGLICKITDMS